MTLTSRQILLKIETPTKEDKISVSLLSDKLKALQYLVWNIGSAKKGAGGARGTFPAEIQQSCALNFVNSTLGSLTIVAELPSSQVLSDEMDPGIGALRSTVETLQILSNGEKTEHLQKLYPDRSQRLRIVKSALKLYPEEESQYELELQCAGLTSSLKNETKQSIFTYLQDETVSPLEETVQILTGTLYLIEVVSERKIGIIHNNRKIPCQYSPDLEQIICDLIPGTLVEVEGHVLFNERDEVQQFTDIIDIRTVQLNPLLWSRLDYNNKRFIFTRSITIIQDFKSSFWTHECPELNILSYGKSRGESLESFRFIFDSLHQNIALEDDKNLTADAKELKEKFKQIISEVKDI